MKPANKNFRIHISILLLSILCSVVLLTIGMIDKEYLLYSCFSLFLYSELVIITVFFFGEYIERKMPNK